MARKLAATTLIVILLGSAAPAWSFDHPLSREAVREAYFLGRRMDQTTAAFLAQYTKHLPMPKQGAHVAQIEVQTPYQQAVLRAWQAPLGYTSLSAQQDYHARRDTVFVRIEINLTPTYPAILSSARGVQFPSSEFWRDFSIRVTQSKPIAPKRVRGRALYLFGESGPFQLRGAEVFWNSTPTRFPRNPCGSKYPARTASRWAAPSSISRSSASAAPSTRPRARDLTNLAFAAILFT